jgi:hypothetical protein
MEVPGTNMTVAIENLAFVVTEQLTKNCGGGTAAILVVEEEDTVAAIVDDDDDISFVVLDDEGVEVSIQDCTFQKTLLLAVDEASTELIQAGIMTVRVSVLEDAEEKWEGKMTGQPPAVVAVSNVQDSNQQENDDPAVQQEKESTFLHSTLQLISSSSEDAPEDEPGLELTLEEFKGKYCVERAPVPVPVPVVVTPPPKTRKGLGRWLKRSAGSKTTRPIQSKKQHRPVVTPEKQQDISKTQDKTLSQEDATKTQPKTTLVQEEEKNRVVPETTQQQAQQQEMMIPKTSLLQEEQMIPHDTTTREQDPPESTNVFEITNLDEVLVSEEEEEEEPALESSDCTTSSASFKSCAEEQEQEQQDEDETEEDEIDDDELDDDDDPSCDMSDSISEIVRGRSFRLIGEEVHHLFSLK